VFITTATVMYNVLHGLHPLCSGVQVSAFYNLWDDISAFGLSTDD